MAKLSFVLFCLSGSSFWFRSHLYHILRFKEMTPSKQMYPSNT